MTMELLLLQRIVPVLRRVTIDQLYQLHYTRETCSHKSWVRGNLLRMPGPNQTDFFKLNGYIYTGYCACHDVTTKKL
jgi:hypothetical protein